MTKSRGIGRGGARPGSGRKPQLFLVEIPEKLEPRAFLVRIMQDNTVDIRRRIEAAIALLRLERGQL